MKVRETIFIVDPGIIMATRPLLPKSGSGTVGAAGRSRNVNNIQDYGAIGGEEEQIEVGVSSQRLVEGVIRHPTVLL